MESKAPIKWAIEYQDPPPGKKRQTVVYHEVDKLEKIENQPDEEDPTYDPDYDVFE